MFFLRLIKVEEELKREKIEMNKLLKAKQEIIDVQKKRIEGMANRLAHSQFQHQQQTRYNNQNIKHKQNITDLYSGLQQQQQIIKVNTNNIKTFSTPINSTTVSTSPITTATIATTSLNNNNNDLRNHHPHVNHVTLNTTHFLRTSEL
jgi:hypothetical protein